MNAAFTTSHVDTSPFAGEGLRAFFDYGGLGIAEATDRRCGAQVVRAVPGRTSPGDWHSHRLELRMVYVTRGRILFEYEGEGEHLLRAGSCVLRPPGIRHRDLPHSDDMELIEITAPAAFEADPEEVPEGS